MQNIDLFWSLLPLLYRSPICLFSSLQLNPSSSHNSLLLPKCKLGIAMNNFVFGACSMWNKCIDRILSKPVLTKMSDSKGNDIEIIIPGSTTNSDLTCSVAAFKIRLKQILLVSQKCGDPKEWCEINSLIP